jgi:hypothetical protein
MDTMVLHKLTCKRCNPPHSWFPKTENLPKKCPKCGSPYWNKERKDAEVDRHIRSKV